jgi:NAD(P)-dependent dehydrogenase (short-subunit alcohol dehydrogenase family)
MSWTADHIPPLTGRRAVVTGANSGLGLQTALQLAAHGAQVTLACRDEERGRAALAQVEQRGAAQLALVDLASLASVRDFAATVTDPVDILVDNAGVMAVPRRLTADGFEMQLGTNHLGHFALTGLLWEQLVAAEAARVVVVSSNAHRMGRMNFDDLMGEQSYSRSRAYGQSKLANLLFVRELARRVELAGGGPVVAAAHPGYAATNLTSGFTGRRGPLRAAGWLVDRALGQSDAAGALPTLRAATMADVNPGDYFGPGSFGGWRGAPVLVGRSPAALDDAVAKRLWDVSEQLTGVTYPGLPG